MKATLKRRPSAAMVVAIVSLVVAASGTAVAASHLVKGDKLIAKNSLSGNRLKNKTITGTQVNLKKLGKVPSAAKADSATSATTATTATTAANAGALSGQPASAFEPSANWTRTGLVKATSGQTVPLATFGPFTLSLKCVAGAGSAVASEIDATSTEANSDGYGTQMTTAGTSYVVLGPNGSSTTFQENDDNAADFFTPSGKTYLADLTVGENYLGAACFANARVSPS